MSKAAVDAKKIKELEDTITEMNLTIQAQSQTIVGYVNREVDLHRTINVLRAAFNGATSEPESE